MAMHASIHFVAPSSFPKLGLKKKRKISKNQEKNKKKPRKKQEKTKKKNKKKPRKKQEKNEIKTSEFK